MTKKEFPLFPLRLSHKGKNKGKYISFHYLRGWKARKIRKVQEISPQIPIFHSLRLPNKREVVKQRSLFRFVAFLHTAESHL